MSCGRFMYCTALHTLLIIRKPLTMSSFLKRYLHISFGSTRIYLDTTMYIQDMDRLLLTRLQIYKFTHSNRSVLPTTNDFSQCYSSSSGWLHMQVESRLLCPRRTSEDTSAVPPRAPVPWDIGWFCRSSTHELDSPARYRTSCLRSTPWRTQPWRVLRLFHSFADLQVRSIEWTGSSRSRYTDRLLLVKIIFFHSILTVPLDHTSPEYQFSQIQDEQLLQACIRWLLPNIAS